MTQFPSIATDIDQWSSLIADQMKIKGNNLFLNCIVIVKSAEQYAK